MKDILKGLKAKRIEKGLSQQELADMLGITQNALSCYERGISFPRRDMLDNLARVLKCEVKDFFDNNEANDKLTERDENGLENELLSKYTSFSKLFEAYLLIEGLSIKKTLSKALVEVGESLISILRR